MMSEHHIVLENIELLSIIVNFGQGGKVLNIAKQCGVNGGTICLAHGTVNIAFSICWDFPIFAKKLY